MAIQKSYDVCEILIHGYLRENSSNDIYYERRSVSTFFLKDINRKKWNCKGWKRWENEMQYSWN